MSDLVDKPKKKKSRKKDKLTETVEQVQRSLAVPDFIARMNLAIRASLLAFISLAFFIGHYIEFLHFCVPLFLVASALWFTFHTDQLVVFNESVFTEEIIDIPEKERNELIEAKSMVHQSNITANFFWITWILLSYIYVHEPGDFFLPARAKNWALFMFSLVYFLTIRVTLVSHWFPWFFNIRGIASVPVDGPALPSTPLVRTQELAAYMNHKLPLSLIFLGLLICTLYPCGSSVIESDERLEFLVKSIAFHVLFYANSYVWREVFKKPNYACVHAMSGSMWVVSATPVIFCMSALELFVLAVEADVFGPYLAPMFSAPGEGKRSKRPTEQEKV